MTPLVGDELSHRVSVSVPAKVNLQLSIGALRADGYHDLVTVFQAVSLYDEVTVTAADRLSVRVAGAGTDAVPTDRTNLAARAAELLAEEVGMVPLVGIDITKRIPVAGGMAGGSADAAAALVACNTLWRLGFSTEELHPIAARLGSDVPFSLLGGTAVGEGRGEILKALPTFRPIHWALAFAHHPLSTPSVYRELDRLRGADVDPIELAQPLLDALDAGDPVALGEALSNDAEQAALTLAPHLGTLLNWGSTAGALGSIVSGTGPTCAFLGRDEAHARDMAAELAELPLCRRAEYAYGPVDGPKVVPDEH
ncbi:4-(cytidine 5'-diphospho)-2-C-methyl-D-erythritol kinase [Actinokineospora sp.]|uniref:4-(cytidine 5'-diphospho)-2-C-methyl-D-erythritol kinase n=1 Tax=Actinokineospora sp. TaxID=1872133 RepID=UPI004038348E